MAKNLTMRTFEIVALKAVSSRQMFTTNNHLVVD